MKEFFRAKNFGPESISRIRKCNEIITAYLGQGMRLTLRQLYYQLVSRNEIVNSEKSYKRLGEIVSDGRLAGVIDWDAIEDRVRVPRLPPEWDSIQDLVEGAANAFRLPRWEDQENYVELWVEKDALAGVLRPLASEFHVPLMVNRGYSSQSAMYEAAARYRAQEENGKNLHLLYLGDHDPSGEDMVRDIVDRLEMFEVHDFDVEKIALTIEQVKRYKPPPNPAKFTDSRAAAYVAKHGPQSWEVDAIPPVELQRLIRNALAALVDEDAMDAVKKKEEEQRKKLRKAAAGIK